MSTNIQIADLELQITSNSASAVEGIDKLILSLEKIKNIGDLGLNKIARQFTNFNKKIQALDIGRIQELQAFFKSISDIRAPQDVAANAASAGQAAEQVAADAGKAKSTTIIGQLAQDTANLERASKKASKNQKDLNKNVKDTDKAAKKASGAIGKFIKSIARIALYRVVRSMIKGIGNAFKEGTHNLYEFDKEFSGTFSKSMDSISTSALSIKNSLALSFAPIVEQLAPVIERVSELFMQLGNTISKVSAQVNGKTTYTKATKSLKEYGDSIEKAKNATQGFDELNIAEKGTDVSTMFEEVEIGDELSESESSLADLFSTLKEIGEIIKTEIAPFIKDVLVQVLPALVPVIKFIASIIKEIISTLGDILNGDEMTSTIETLKNVIMSIVGVLQNFMPNIQKILQIIAKVLKVIIGFIDRIINNGINKAENGATTLNTIIGGILDIIDSILDLLSPILDVVFEIVDIITSLVDAVLVGIQPILEAIFDIITPIVRMLVDLIASFIRPLVPILQLVVGLIQDYLAPVLERIGTFLKPLLELIGTALQGIIGWISGLVEIFNNSFGDAIEGLVLLWKAFFALFSGDTDKMADAWTKLGEHFKNIWNRLWDNIKGVFTKIINGIITGFEKFVNALIKGINWITEKASKIWTWTGLDAIPQIAEVSFNRIGGYASGGYGIPNGQLFVANERGAEMVGSMDGKTAVANNQQIVEGIKQGVYDAILAASSNQGSNNGNINLALYLDGRQIKAEIDRLSQSKGASIATGGLVYYG